MSRPDIARFKEDIHPRAVIDLRAPRELTKQREINLLGEVGARYHNVPFSPASPDYIKQETELFRGATDERQMGTERGELMRGAAANAAATASHDDRLAGEQAGAEHRLVGHM